MKASVPIRSLSAFALFLLGGFAALREILRLTDSGQTPLLRRPDHARDRPGPQHLNRNHLSPLDLRPRLALRRAQKPRPFRKNLENFSGGVRGFARVCRVEDSKVSALPRAIGVRGPGKSPMLLKADAVDRPLEYRRPRSPRVAQVLQSPAPSVGNWKVRI
jgi:hypothetical protein